MFRSRANTAARRRSGIRSSERGGRLGPGLLAWALAILLSAPFAPLAGAAQQPNQPVGQDRSLPTSSNRWYAETGHNVKDPFLSRWTAAGGAEVVGLPISEERYLSGSGGIHQSFAGLTLVYDPTVQAPWDVQGQPLPGKFVRELAPFDARRGVDGCRIASNNCTYFFETGHTLAGQWLSFWSTHGERPILGMPLSEVFEDEESGTRLQVLERAVLEADSEGNVRLRPVVAELAEADGSTADPAFLPSPPNGGTTWLVDASDGLRLRSGPSVDADVLLVLPDNAEFIAAPGSDDGWVPGYVDGFVGWVSQEWLTEPPPLPERSLEEWKPDVWQGAALGETNIRAQPTTDARIVDELFYGDPVEVVAWVKGEEVYEAADLWAQLGPNRYVYARNIGRNAPVLPPPLPPDAPAVGRWIDVDLTQQVMTAYDGRTPVRVVETTTGMAGWETPPGFYSILRRVANETMTSGAIGAESYYKLEDVFFTQYFTDRGHAIHFAWWRTAETIGRPGSHGCLNLLLDDARFFWDWATIGTPVYVHP